MGNEWDGSVREGEMCVHNTVFKPDLGTGFVVVACRYPCRNFGEPVQTPPVRVLYWPEVVSNGPETTKEDRIQEAAKPDSPEGQGS